MSELTRREFLKRGIELSLVLSIGSSGFYGLRELSAPYPNTHLLVLAAWPQAHLPEIERVRIVDARAPLKYRQGHIENAVSIWDGDVNTWTGDIPRQVASPQQIKEVFSQAGIDQNITVVIYDDDQNLWAARLFWMLDYYGHSNVKLLNGGLQSWLASGGRLTDQPLELPKARFEPRPDANKIVTGDWLLEHLYDPTVKLVDARSPEEYSGMKTEARRGGHIPGAMLLPWDRTLNRDGTFKRAHELKKLYKQAGLRWDQTIVVYSHTGVRAAHAYFALRLLGYPDVRLYDGSWAEWGNNETYPVATVERPPGQKSEHRSTCW